MNRPFLTEARAPLTREIEVVNEHGERQAISIPAERPLTVYVDKRELVTLMTLGEHPEWLVLGYLINQRLIAGVADIESITVDWEVSSAAVRTRTGIDRIEERTARRVVTTGCGQGSVFGGLMDDVENIALPPAAITQAELYAIVNAIRLQDSTYKSAGSVHGCALFRADEMMIFVEDVGRHNAIDTIAGWMALEGLDPRRHEPAAARADTHEAPGPLALEPLPATDRPLVFYTTGRLTSEMVIKSAQMGVAIAVSRSGITEMGLAIARRLGLCAIGRATNRHFLCFSAPERLRLQPELAGPRLRAVA